MTDPRRMRQAYKSAAAEAGRLIEGTAEAERRLVDAEAALEATRADAETQRAVLDGLDGRAAAIWRELTTRFGARETGAIPEPAPDADPDADAAGVLRDAHHRVREPVRLPHAIGYARMALMGFCAALVTTVVGIVVAVGIHGSGGSGAIVALVALAPVVAAPWSGYLAARAWVRMRTANEKRRYAAGAAAAGAVGGAAIWLIGLVIWMFGEAA